MFKYFLKKMQNLMIGTVIALLLAVSVQAENDLQNNPKMRCYYRGEKINLTSNLVTAQYLFTESHKVDSSVQGAAIYGKYLFQFNNYCERWGIYNLDTRELIQSIEFEPDKLLHCNNANFGKQYFDPSDPFPLLYISMENIAKHNVYVFRITGEEGNYSVKHIQTITWPTPESCNCYYPNVVVDNENNRIIQMGYTQNNYHVAENNQLVINIYPLPDGKITNVVFTAKDILDSFKLDSVTATQGAFCKDGKIYQVYGVKDPCTIRVTDLNRKLVVSLINLPELGILGEQEGLGYYNEGIIMVGVNKKVYFLKP